MIGGGIQWTKTCSTTSRYYRGNFNIYLTLADCQMNVMLFRVLFHADESSCVASIRYNTVFDWLTVIYHWIQGRGGLCALYKASGNFAYLWLDFLQLFQIESLLADSTVVSLKRSSSRSNFSPNLLRDEPKRHRRA